jgi:tryptophanyl-tRNA synthetase
VELLRPIRERRAALAADPGAVTSLLALGADKAGVIASVTYRRAADAIGLLTPG